MYRAFTLADKVKDQENVRIFRLNAKKERYANHKNQTRMTVCNLQRMSRSLGPGRSHQEHQSPCSTLIVTAQQSADRPAQHLASRGTISQSHAGPYHWMPGSLAKPTPDCPEPSSASKLTSRKMKFKDWSKIKQNRTDVFRPAQAYPPLCAPPHHHCPDCWMSPLSSKFYCWSRQRSEGTTPAVEQREENHIKYLEAICHTWTKLLKAVHKHTVNTPVM